MANTQTDRQTDRQRLPRLSRIVDHGSIPLPRGCMGGVIGGRPSAPRRSWRWHQRHLLGVRAGAARRAAEPAPWPTVESPLRNPHSESFTGGVASSRLSLSPSKACFLGLFCLWLLCSMKTEHSWVNPYLALLLTGENEACNWILPYIIYWDVLMQRNILGVSTRALSKEFRLRGKVGVTGGPHLHNLLWVDAVLWNGILISVFFPCNTQK